MKPIIIALLAAQAAVLIAATLSMAIRPTKSRPRPLWINLALSLVLVASTSWTIAAHHEGAAGVELLRFGSPLLLGFALAMILMALRQRRGLELP